MKLLFDQNISYRILNLLSNDFSGSTHVKKEGLVNESDRVIWEFAKTNGYTIVSQDADFNDLSLLNGFPPKIVWIRTGNLPTKAILFLLNQHLNDLTKFIFDNEHGCFEILKIKMQ